ALLRLEIFDLLPELLVARGCEYDFLQSYLPDSSNGVSARRREEGGHSSWASQATQGPAATIGRMQIDLHEHWFLGGVEIPGRLVLAPMAGVSVQAFRRQGRRYGAGLVCSEMVSVAGIQHRNERTLGYLRVASDEHPLAIQIFGSDPAAMGEAA